MTSVPKFLDPADADAPLDLHDDLETTGRRFRRRHVFEEDDMHAVNAALASGRPLLLRGKPGTGKSQLALASAVALERAFVSEIIDALTESRDLLWRFDAVRRLADAQVVAVHGDALKANRKKWLGNKDDVSKGDVLHESFYTAPGPLWWAFDWDGASRQAQRAGVDPPPVRKGCDPSRGVVVLLDEIDKADSALPNGLLGALGDGCFSVPGVGHVTCSGPEPLVVITTNEERALPPAFLRRCAVHELALERDANALRHWLRRLGEAHFQNTEDAIQLSDGTLAEAADMVLEDRDFCRREGLHPPGGAEYLDLLRVVAEHSTTDEDATQHLATARRFLLRKTAEETA